MKDGLRIETAAGVTARDMIKQHMAAFHFAIKTDRLASQTTVSAYIDGLAGAVALTITGRHGSREEIISATIAALRNAINRDLAHLK